MSISKRAANLLKSTEKFAERVSSVKHSENPVGQGKFGAILDAAYAFSKVAKDAAVKSRGVCVFPADHAKVTDKKDHFPINSESQARNALAQANKFKKVPAWYKGTLQSLVSAVAKKVHSKYKDIEISDAAKNPGKD